MKERLTIKTKNGYALKLNEPQNDQDVLEQFKRQFKLACEKLGKIEDCEDDAAEAWVVKNEKGEYLSKLNDHTFTNSLLLATLFIHKTKSDFIIGLCNLKTCHPSKVKIAEVGHE